MVNPQARVYLNWFSASWFNAEMPFEDPEIGVISGKNAVFLPAGQGGGLHFR